jgi:predicted PurR-regulated permease PerM
MRAGVRRAYESVRAAQAQAQRDEDDDEPLAPAEPEPTVVARASVTSRDDEEVPRGLRVAAAWSWRLLILAVIAVAVLWLVARLRTVLIPLAISLLLAALLSPAVGFLRRRGGFPQSLAASVVLIGGLAVVVGTLTLVVRQVVDKVGELTTASSAGIRQIQNWLKNGPLHLSNKELNDAVDAVQKWVDEHTEQLAGGAVTTATTALEIFASAVLVLFATFFFLRDGRRIWRFVVGLLPSGAREPLADAGQAAWLSLVAYVRATVLVAFIDAVGIGAALFFLGDGIRNFALPLAALVFLAAFVPIVGATVSGSVAVLVALVTDGPLTALFVLMAVIAVQQLEGHVLQPLIMGRAVAIHPLAVIVAIATGVVVAGIVGALVSVPIVAVLNTGLRRLSQRRREARTDAAAAAVGPAGA